MKRFCMFIVCVVVLLHTHAVQAQTPPPSPLPDRDVRIPAGAQPSMSVTAFANELQRAGSDAATEAQAMYTAIVSVGIEPSFFLAVFKHESNYGTDPNWAGWKDDGTTTHNPGNIVCTPGYQCEGRFRDYPNWTAGTLDWAGLLEEYYFDQGRTTVAEIIEVYAPPSENDTQGYIQQVLRDMAAWAGQSVPALPTQVDPAKLTSEYWVEAPLDGMYYDLMYFASSMAWQLDKAVFLGHEALGQAHASLITGFASILDVVGQAFNPALRGIAVLGLTVAALLLLLAPMFTQNIVSVRRGVAALVFVPMVMTAAGSGFVLIEDVRQGLADWMLGAAGGRAATIFNYEFDNNFPGTSSLGSVQKYYADAPTIGTVDLGAAYMFANYDIVHGDDNLPPDFEQVFFTAKAYLAENTDSGSWSEVPQGDRDLLTGLALRGTTRAGTAFGVSLPALVERLLQLVLTMNVAILFLSLILIVPFIILDSYAALALNLLRQLPQLAAVSALIAVGQGIVAAFLLIAARSGNAWVVVIATSAYGLAVAVAVVVLAVQGLRALLALASTALTGSVAAAQDVGRIAVTGASAAVGGVIGGAIGGGRALQRLDQSLKKPQLPDSAKNIVTAYSAARAAGHNRNFSFGYGISGSKFGQKAAQVGLASGVIGNGPDAPEIERGLSQGVISGRSEPTSLASILRMRQAPKRPARRVSPGQAVGGRYVRELTPLLTQGPLITPPPAAVPAPQPVAPAAPAPAAAGASRTPVAPAPRPAVQRAAAPAAPQGARVYQSPATAPQAQRTADLKDHQ